MDAAQPKYAQTSGMVPHWNESQSVPRLAAGGKNENPLASQDWGDQTLRALPVQEASKSRLLLRWSHPGDAAPAFPLPTPAAPPIHDRALSQGIQQQSSYAPPEDMWILSKEVCPLSWLAKSEHHIAVIFQVVSVFGIPLRTFGIYISSAINIDRQAILFKKEIRCGVAER